jgi:molybdate transport system ATP-binding protein
MIQIDINKALNFASGEMHLSFQLNIERNTFLTLYGKSGAGKTSMLRILSGLLQPETGQIIVNGTTWLDSTKGINLPPQKRSIGFVFQDYALFPNMTVRENLEFALLKKQDPKIIDELIEIVELGDLQSRKPVSISGGQQQRVALARSLVQRPAILLLDEPLAALDIEMRHKLQPYILELHREYNLTTILVSHDIPEVIKMSDWVVYLEQGKIVRQGLPLEMFEEEEEVKLISIERANEYYILTLVVQNRPITVSIPFDQFPAKK